MEFFSPVRRLDRATEKLRVEKGPLDVGAMTIRGAWSKTEGPESGSIAYGEGDTIDSRNLLVENMGQTNTLTGITQSYTSSLGNSF